VDFFGVCSFNHETIMIRDTHTVLLVDDSEDDRFFMRKSLERSSILTVIGETRDGQEAMDYLTGEGIFGDRQAYPIPDVLLLDIKMPRKNGYDVLEWLQSQSFREMTVAVVSGSWLAEDIAKSMILGAHGYFKKTVIKEEEDEMLRGIENLIRVRSGCGTG
jgi:CheY-like chemotaxis protein